jgi:hypothetical protein
MNARLSIPLDAIRVDGGTQPRTALSRDQVAEYASDMKRGDQFPPVTVFFDGSAYWLADGFHRYHARKALGFGEIAADVRQGTRRDAVLFSVGANASHGMRRTNEDKRHAVLTLFSDPEWAAWSDREIARRCGVSDRFVNGIRPSTAVSANGSQIEDTRKVQRGGVVYEMQTGAIGKAAEGKAVKSKAGKRKMRIRKRVTPSLVDRDGTVDIDRLSLSWLSVCEIVEKHGSDPAALAALLRRRSTHFQPTRTRRVAEFLVAVAAALEADQ